MKVYEKKSRCEIFRVLTGEVGQDSKGLIRIETHGTPRIGRDLTWPGLDWTSTSSDFANVYAFLKGIQKSNRNTWRENYVRYVGPLVDENSLLTTLHPKFGKERKNRTKTCYNSNFKMTSTVGLKIKMDKLGRPGRNQWM